MTYEGCEKCHQVHPRGCRGHVDLEDGTLRPCGNAPAGGWRSGATVCKYHGGKAPQTIAAANRRLALAKVEGTVAALAEQLGVVNLRPDDALLASVDRSGVMVAVLEQLVGALPLVERGTEDGEASGLATSMYGPDHLGDGRPHVATEMYRTWLADHAKMAKAAIDAGLDARRVALAENQARDLFEDVAAALNEAGLSPEQSSTFRTALANRLRRRSPKGEAA